MSYFAGMLVRADTIASVVDAVRSAFVARGAVEGMLGERLDVRIGEPQKGWVLVTDSTHHTFDLGVASGVAEAMKTRVAALCTRGSSSHGKAGVKAFGTWKTKPPGSLKPGALWNWVHKLARSIWPKPWELDTRPGVTLSFDVAAMNRAPGPLKDNSATAISEAERGRQTDVAWHVVNGALNNSFDEPRAALGGLHDRWGWQHTFDHYMHSLQSRSIDYGLDAARLMVALARPALSGLTARTIYDNWLVTIGHPGFRPVRLALPILCALTASDDDALDELIAKLDDDVYVHRAALYVRSFSFTALRALSPAMSARLDHDLPLARTLAWLVDQPHDPSDCLLDDGAPIAAQHDDPLATRVVELAVFHAHTDRALANAVARKALSIARAGAFEPALALFDRLLELPELDDTAFCNALWVVQADNNKLAVDQRRAQRYLAACEPHAEANPAIYINAACVRFELGDRDGSFDALAAARRHRLFDELVGLRNEPLFDAVTGARSSST